MKNLIIHGHRGSRGTSPENTLPSFQEAADAGADYVELDVHFSKEKILVVFHDYEISGRICRDAKGLSVIEPKLLSELSIAEIKTYDCGRPDAKIPTLEELVLWKKKNAPKMRLNVEIKNDVKLDVNGDHGKVLAKATLSLLGKHDLLDETLVQSFDHRIVDALRQLNSKVKLSCLFEDEADFAVVTKAHQAQVAAVHFSLLKKEQVDLCKSLGLEVLPWTVNEEKDWKRMIEIGVTSIITDFPKKLADFRHEA